MSEQVQYGEYQENQKKSGRGCCFYGCLGMLLITVLGGLGIFFGGRMMLNQFRDKYTDVAARDLPTVEYTQEDADALTDRITAFRDAMEKGEETGPLELDTRDLNILIAEKLGAPTGGGIDLSDAVYLEIVDDLIRAEISLPLDFLPLWKDRFINASGSVSAEISNGRLGVYVQELEVRGEAFPQAVMDNLSQENLAADAVSQNPELRDGLADIEELVIRDGKIIIIPAKNDGVVIHSDEAAGLDEGIVMETEADAEAEAPAESAP